MTMALLRCGVRTGGEGRWNRRTVRPLVRRLLPMLRCGVRAGGEGCWNRQTVRPLVRRETVETRSGRMCI